MFEDAIRSYLSKLSHQCLPGPNLYSEELNYEHHQKQFPFRCVQHSIFLASDKIPKSVLNGQDPVTSFIRKKMKWNLNYDYTKTRLRRNKTTLQKLRNFKNDISRKDSGVTIQSQKELDYLHFLQLADKDPDRDFKGDYNWYYTGGTLSHVTVSRSHILLSARGKKRDQLYVTRLKGAPEWHPVLGSATKVTPNKGEAIFQVLGVDPGIIGVRQRNNCLVYKLGQDSDTLTLVKCHESSSNKPFTGLDVSAWDGRQYCTITTDRHLRLWDIANSSCIKTGTLNHPDEHSSSNWCSVQFNQEHYNLIVSDCCCIHWWDVRTDIKSYRELSLSSLEKIVESCEDISLVIPSQRSSHMLYVATTHKLLLLDSRAACSPLQSWTHMMGSLPLYGCIAKLDNDTETVCIANQGPGEVQLAIAAPNHFTRLLQLPTLQESLSESQAQGHCLSPQLWQRLGLSCTGITFLPKQRKGLDLLTQTSGGDVFCQKLRPAKVTGRGMHGLEGMNLKRIPTRLSGSSRYNMKTLCSDLTKTDLKLPNNHSKTSPVAKWQQSKYQLQSYVDLLAPKLLEVWDIDNYPEWETSVDLSVEELKSLHQNVESWLNTQQSPTVGNSTINDYLDAINHESNLSQDIFSSQTEETHNWTPQSQNQRTSQQFGKHDQIGEESALQVKLTPKKTVRNRMRKVSGF